MFKYHLSFSNEIFYCYAFDEFKRPAGRFKSSRFYDVIRWIAEREGIDYETSGRFITESWSTL